MSLIKLFLIIFFMEVTNASEFSPVKVTAEYHQNKPEQSKKFCPQCQKENKKSKIWASGLVLCTLLACDVHGHYDEDGLYIPPKNPNCNNCTQGWQCSKGHEWNEIY